MDTQQSVKPRRAGIDPVCGMTVDLDHPKGGKVVHEGREIGFCSRKCKGKFEAAPERYLRAGGPAKEKAPVAPPGTIWTCPMHPEVRANGPGTCPICGMALEPEGVTSAEEE